MDVHLLAFGPHPDDVEIGMGATLARHVTLGARVGVCDLTRGEMGSNGTPDERVAEGDRIDVPQRNGKRRRPRDAPAVHAAERARARRIDAVGRGFLAHEASLRSASARVTFDCDLFGTPAISGSVDFPLRLFVAIDRYRDWRVGS